MIMWVLYDHPKDFPDKYVARKWHVQNGRGTPTDEIITDDELDELREKMQRKCLTKIQRNTIDDPVIIETWM